MKKILLFFILFLNICYVHAIEDIEINDEYLIPRFDKSIKKYNYFTSNDKINIKVKPSSNETVSGEGELLIGEENSFIVKSSNNEEYTIKVFKNYKKDNTNGYLEELDIEGYNLEFNRKKHEYYINIDNETYLKINYKLSNDNVHFSISGNGNFNESDNIITVNVNDEKYTIHALKTLGVSITNNTDVEKKEPKKEIVIIIISTISCLLIVFYFYSLFIFN